MIRRARTLPIAGAVALGATLASPASAHIEITSPPQRFVYSNNGQKTGPCGSGAATGTVTPFSAGDEITVVWTEHIDHPGHFRIALDVNDDGVDDFLDPTGYEDKAVAGNIVAFIDDAGGTSFEHTFTLPTDPCDACVLQVMQVMTDAPPWGPAGGIDLYYWCADLSIEGAISTSASSATGAGSGGGSPVGAGAGGGSSGSGASSGAGGGMTGEGAGGTSAGDDSPLTVDDGGCAVGGRSPALSRTWWLLVVLAWACARRRSSS